MRVRNRIVVVGFALSLLFGPPALLGDGAQTGTVDGRVIDAAGAPLPGVSITLAGPQGQERITSGEDGRFRFNLVSPGDYTIGASLEGLGSDEVEGTLAAGQRLTVSLRLQAAAAEAITVMAEAPLADKYAVGSTAALESAVAEELSFRGRQYQSSLEVLPSVVHDAQSRLAGDIQFAVNGGAFNEVVGFVDGVDTSFTRTGGTPRLFLPTTSITEARLESAGFGAEYGRAVGGIASAVVKSGTNQFHGAFLWIPQSQKWRAPYEALDIPRDDEIINSFETALGGPLVRDKAWFFASYAQEDSNEVDQTLDGSIVDVGSRNEVSVLKLNVQPSSRHYLSLLGIDNPLEKAVIAGPSGDRFTPCACDAAHHFFTGTWSYSITRSLFLELKAADLTSDTDRASLQQRELQPGASADSPLGNNFQYWDRASGLRYNAIAQPLAVGFINAPRRQANASLGVFAGDHELKFGGDYQDVELEQFNQIGKRYQGGGFEVSRPGGFVIPEFVDVFVPAQPFATRSDIRSIYAQDRVTIGEHWVFFAGLRFDDQTLENDIGEEAAAISELAPRLSAVYDVNANGRFLVKANTGRYYQVFNQDWATNEFSRLPTGANIFDRFLWNPATLRYDRFQRRFLPAASNAIQQVDPYYKDEATAGIEWQFAESWVFEAQGIWWQLEDLFSATDQFDANGVPYRDARNWDAAFRKYKGLRLEVNRAFRNHWTLRSNYTIGESLGNQFGQSDDLFEGLGGIEVGTGRTDATGVNRVGVGAFDRKHNLNLLGLKQIVIGRHVLGLGANASFRSGERWGLRPNTTIRHPVSGRTIAASTYRTPRDANAMEDTFSLNTTATWMFPITGRVEGRVGVEVYNLTDEQEVIGITLVNGAPTPGRFGIQTPREIRLQAGITF